MLLLIHVERQHMNQRIKKENRALVTNNMVDHLVSIYKSWLDPCWGLNPRPCTKETDALSIELP